MRLLLDTHALLWWLDGDAKLSLAAPLSNETLFDSFKVQRLW